MTGKERAAMRKQANTLPAIFQIGKGDVGESLLSSVDDALKKRELIKLSVLETANVSVEQAAADIASALGAEVVQCIGRKFVLYRKKPEDA